MWYNMESGLTLTPKNESICQGRTLSHSLFAKVEQYVGHLWKSYGGT